MTPLAKSLSHMNVKEEEQPVMDGRRRSMRTRKSTSASALTTSASALGSKRENETGILLHYDKFWCEIISVKRCPTENLLH